LRDFLLPVVPMLVVGPLLFSVSARADLPRPVTSANQSSPILRPSLEQMDEVVREALTAAQDRLDRLLQESEASRPELIAAYGDLGELYLVYSLPEAASSCFVNARRLAPRELRWIYLLGTIHHRGGELEKAREYLRQAQSLAPGDKPTELRLAQIEFALGEVAAAEKRFKGLIGVEGFGAAAHYGLGRIDSARGATAEAVEHFESAVAAQPQASAARYQLGISLREFGELERSRELLSEWGRTEVEFPDPVLENLGQGAVGAAIYVANATMARTRGDLAGVVEAYRKAVGEDPTDIDSRRALASALNEVGDAAGAMSEYQEILRLQPDDTNTLYNMGTILAGQGDLDGAISYLRRAMAVAPDHADARVNLAMILEERGELAAAEDLYAQALEIAPYDLQIKVYWAELLTRRQRTGEALEILAALLEEDPDNATVMLAMGDARRADSNEDAALEAYARVLNLETESEHLARAHVRIAELYLGADRLQEATTYLQQAARLLPDSREIRLALANALGRAGEFARAADQFREAVRLEPRDEQSRFGQAIALLLAGLDLEARAALEESLAALPASIPLQHLLARLLATSADPKARDGRRALGMAQAVFRAQQNIDHAETVAMAHAELREFAQALEWQRQVIEQARLGGDAERLEQLRRRQSLYEKALPCRTPWLEDG